MYKKEIRHKLKECFKRCALGRKKIRNCVVDIMDAGLTKQDILLTAEEMATGKMKDEAYLCAITAIGKALRYEEIHKKTKTFFINKETKNLLTNKLKNCFKGCGVARKNLRECVAVALNSGLTKEEVLAIIDDMIGDFGKDEISVCAIIAVEQVLIHNETENLRNMIKIYAPYMQFPSKF